MSDGPTIPEVDLSKANVARMYDYLLGGAHNFAVDRELADRALAADPDVMPAARELRSFMRRAVRLCLERGIDQFLDLGSGIPTVGNVHEVARREVPGARVAYVDHEPVAVQQSRELLRGVDGVTSTLADMREPEAVLGTPTVTDVIDFERPVALLLLAVLHFVPGDAAALVETYRRRLAPGSALAVSHGSVDWDDPELADRMRRRQEIYRHSALPGTSRDRVAIGALFGDAVLADPGLVDVAHWRPDTTPGRGSGNYGGVGFLPARSSGTASS